MESKQPEHITTLSEPLAECATREEQEQHLRTLNTCWWLECLNKIDQLAITFQLFLDDLERGVGSKEDLELFQDVLRLKEELLKTHQWVGTDAPSNLWYQGKARAGRIEEERWFTRQGINLDSDMRYYDLKHNRHILPAEEPASPDA